MKILLNTLLLFLSIYMIYLGIKNTLLPPILTGVGFILIIILFFLSKGRLK